MVVVVTSVGERIQAMCLSGPFGPMVFIVALTTTKTGKGVSCCTIPDMLPEKQTRAWAGTIDTCSGTLHKVDLAAVDGRDQSDS